MLLNHTKSILNFHQDIVAPALWTIIWSLNITSQIAIEEPGITPTFIY